MYVSTSIIIAPLSLGYLPVLSFASAVAAPSLLSEAVSRSDSRTIPVGRTVNGRL